jgi:hypothetical protein
VGISKPFTRSLLVEISGNEKERHPAVGRSFGQFEAGHVGQYNIDHRQIGPTAPQDTRRRSAIAGTGDSDPAVRLQANLQDISHMLVVINHKEL